MDIEIRPIREDELETFVRVTRGSFGETSEMTDRDRDWYLRTLDLTRTFCAFEGELLVGTSANLTLRMTVPAGEVGCAGTTMIGVLPSHRRQGVLNRMMRSLLDDARSRQEPVAALWASEEAIYQRYGFGLAANEGHIDMARRDGAFAVHDERSGRLRMLSLDEARPVLPGIYERLRAEVPGMLKRSEDWWEVRFFKDPEQSRQGASAHFCAIFEDDGGEPEGYVLYRLKPRWSTGGTSEMVLRLKELVAVTPAAERELWRFLFSVDLVERIQGWFLPSDVPLSLILADPRRARFSTSESFWLRLVDVAGALTARGYSSDGRVTLGLGDALLPDNAGTWEVKVDGGRAAVKRTGAEPEIELDVAALAAVYLGEFTFRQLWRAGRATENSEGALDRADGLFRTYRAPWCPENF